MITFSKYSEIVNAIAKKLKVSKDEAVNALVKAQEKGINPLKWQKHLTMLQTFVQIVAGDFKERLMTQPQKVAQMQHYWDNLWHMATDKVKKKSMFTRFGIKNIKLGKNGKIISFDEGIDYEEKTNHAEKH